MAVGDAQVFPGDAPVFPGFLTPVLIQLSFQSHRLLFSHASAEVRGKSKLEADVKINFHEYWTENVASWAYIRFY